MPTISLCPIDATNWRAALRLAVRPEQQHFVADDGPIAAVIFAKALVQAGGLIWTPYGIAADRALIGMLALAAPAGQADQLWVFHLFIDQRQQRNGYGTAALRALVGLVRAQYPACHALHVTVHPENVHAQAMYRALGFRPRGDMLFDEPVWTLALLDAVL